MKLVKIELVKMKLALAAPKRIEMAQQTISPVSTLRPTRTLEAGMEMIGRVRLIVQYSSASQVRMS